MIVLFKKGNKLVTMVKCDQKVQKDKFEKRNKNAS